MTAYGFKRQFCPQIVDGTKGGTIRDERLGRAGHVKPGGMIQFYTAMRTKQCRRIMPDRPCLGVLPIRLDFSNHLLVIGKFGRPAGVALQHEGQYDFVFSGREKLDAFARFDGFENWRQLHGFWIDNHDQPAVYDGYHIRWLPWPDALRP